MSRIINNIIGFVENYLYMYSLKDAQKLYFSTLVKKDI